MRDSYLQYKASELASEHAFLQWVHSPESELGVQWTEWLTKHPEMFEEAELAKRMVSHMKFQQLQDFPTNTADLWKRIDASIEVEEVPTLVIDRNAGSNERSSRIWYNIGLVAAACIAILFILRFLSPQEFTLDVPRGEHMVHQLPDESQVEINAESNLHYSSKGWEKERLVNLEGEAYFRVKKGKKFTVNTPMGAVEVLGTSFNVYNRGKDFRVSCMTGSVQVSSHHGDLHKVLLPGQSVQWNPEDGNVDKTFEVDEEEKNSWWNGTYSFKDAPLFECFEELGRQFNLEVELGPKIDRNEEWTGHFSGSNVDQALYDVCWSNGLEYRQEGNIVYITQDTVRHMK
ncbi:MAG: FecR domain-containing protein [Bacteroidota bacterium]